MTQEQKSEWAAVYKEAEAVFVNDPSACAAAYELIGKAYKLGWSHAQDDATRRRQGCPWLRQYH